MRKEHIPWLLAALRAALGPIMVTGALCSWSAPAMVGVLLTGLFSDIFDGILARRWHCDTIPVRRFDSLADNIFYLCAALSLWHLRPDLIHANLALLIAVIAFEALNILFAIAKFGKVANYHSAMAKLWGMLLASAITAAIFGRGGVLIPIALAFGCITNLETFTMSLMLPTWHKDIWTLAHAYRLRRQIISTTVKTSRRSKRNILTAAFTSMLFALSLAPQLRAQSAAPITFLSGTESTLTANATGYFLYTAPQALTFQTTSPQPGATTPTQFAIPYDSITRYQYESPVVHHLGVLPIIAVGLLAPRLRNHILTITYIGKMHTSEIAIFQLAQEEDSRILLALLRARSASACQVTEYSNCHK